MRHQYLCPYGPYLAGDGRYVNLVVASEPHWERFCTVVVDRPDWSADPRFRSVQARSENRTALEGMLEPLIAAKPSSVWIERLRAAELPYGEVRRMAEVLTHPQLLDAHTFVEATSPVGTLPLVRFPLSPPDRERRIPALGEHTEAILTELGYSEALIQQLGADGVVQ
jgi:crotonobetainyl-CoA:carnitine CoA-transferase CaiB-like acyl-CoA transferase